MARTKQTARGSKKTGMRVQSLATKPPASQPEAKRAKLEHETGHWVTVLQMVRLGVSKSKR
jgi:hypothetical protein